MNLAIQQFRGKPPPSAPPAPPPAALPPLQIFPEKPPRPVTVLCPGRQRIVIDVTLAALRESDKVVLN